MAFETALAIGSMAASAAGAGVSAFGALQQGAAGAAAAKYQASIAAMNEKIARQNADYARAMGEVEAQRSGMKSRFAIGQTLATQGSRGLDVNVGSPAQVRESMGAVAEQDQATIRANAARQAYGHEVQAVQETAKGKLATMAGEGAETAGYIGAASSILGGASSVAGKWMQASQMGMLGGTKQPGTTSSSYFG